MDFSSPHLSFVLASYVISAAVLGGLIISIWLRGKRAITKLQTLEERSNKRKRPAVSGKTS